MNDETYAWPLQEFMAGPTSPAVAARFSVFELTPTRGFRLHVKGFELSQACRVFIQTTTAIEANLAAATVFLHNPPGFQVGGSVGDRADAGSTLLYLSSLGLRDYVPMQLKVDSIAGQRLVFVGQTVNTVLQVSVHGIWTNSSVE